MANRKFLNSVNTTKLGRRNVTPPLIIKLKTVVIKTPQPNIGITTGLHLHKGKGEPKIKSILNENRCSALTKKTACSQLTVVSFEKTTGVFFTSRKQ